MPENPESQPTLKEFQEAVRLQLDKLGHKLDEQQRAQEKLLNDLTEQAKRQRRTTDRRLQEIDKTLTQHKQEIQQLNHVDLLQATTAQSGQQPPATLPKKSTGTGFFDKTLFGKTLWDWLNLFGVFLIPLMIGVFTIALTIQQSNISQQQHNTDIQIADMQNKEAILAAYQSSITDLLLSHKLGSVNLDDQEVAHISAISAQSLTVVTIPRLDAKQKVILIQFLYKVNLINHGRPIISLNSVDLSGINLARINLAGINLSGANMTRADLSGANLTQAYLWHTDLTGAMLQGTTLTKAYLLEATLNTDLNSTNLSDTDLSDSNLIGANLSPDNLHKAIQAGADFCYAKGITYTCPRTASSGDSGLEDDLTKWSSSMLTPTMANRGEPPILVNNVVNVTAPTYDKDGHALQIFLLGGDPYTTLQAYRSVSFPSTTTKFDFSLSFYITEFAIREVPPIQALEFTLSWGKGPIYSKAILQWQQIGDGKQQQGHPPNWRVGPDSSKSSGWNDINQPQQLMVGKWYTLDLRGEIVGNKMHFLNFSCTKDFVVTGDDATKYLDVKTQTLNQTFPFSPEQDPLNMNNQLMNIGIQMDGNAHEDPYDVYLDGVNF